MEQAQLPGIADLPAAKPPQALAPVPAGPVEPSYPTIRELPREERPAQRLAMYGEGVLSTSELLGLQIGTPHQVRVAMQVLADYGGLPRIANAPIIELMRYAGIGQAAATRIKAALELGKRMAAARPEERSQVKSPADAANLVLTEMTLLEQEELRIMLLDTKCRVVRIYTLYRGSLNVSLVRVGEVFRQAVREQCYALIMVHNHPSGDPTPSPEDIQLTRDVFNAGKLMDIELVDHIIIGGNRFISLKERGLSFS